MKFFSIKVGDVIQMGELLRVAGIDLNSDKNIGGDPRRSEGFIIQIDVDYTNTQMWHFPPWETAPIRYTYRAGLLPTETYKQVTEEVAADGSARVLNDMHGVFVSVKLTGSICYFSVSEFILVMTTGLGLLAVAQWAVGAYATYIWKHRDVFKSIKTDRSENFNKVEGLDAIIGDEGAAEVKQWRMYADNHTEFTKDFKSLDGETLGVVSDLLVGMYTHLDDDMKSKIEITMAHNARCREDELVRTETAGYMKMPKAGYP